MYKQPIYYFLAVVEEGSFSAASKQFFLSQSAISQQITKLEDELGFKLFNRSTYRPTLTIQGKEFYQLCKSSLQSFTNELNRIKHDSNIITIGITGPFEKKHIPIIIREFKKKQDVTINIKLFDFIGIVNHLMDHTIEIGFGLMNDFQNNNKLQYDNIYQAHICAVTAKEHRFASEKSITMADIKDEPIVVLSSKFGTNYYADFLNAFELDGIRPNIVKTADNLNEYLMAIELGEGIGLSAKEVINENDDVVTVDLLNTHHSAFYSVAMLNDNNNTYVQELYKEILEYFRHYK